MINKKTLANLTAGYTRYTSKKARQQLQVSDFQWLRTVQTQETKENKMKALNYADVKENVQYEITRSDTFHYWEVIGDCEWIKIASEVGLDTDEECHKEAKFCIALASHYGVEEALDTYSETCAIAVQDGASRSITAIHKNQTVIISEYQRISFADECELWDQERLDDGLWINVLIAKPNWDDWIEYSGE